ncbi:hypothetical protein N5C38_23760 [Pseudomonas chengduensis]|nr:hypothetical protein [Pseudomonas chengduensis]MDH1214042.1 hypothetical protein [Pseudomonas chengduensis]
MRVKYPDPLLEVRACFLDKPALVALCAGFDCGEWRSRALADHIFQWIPFVALDQESQLSMGAHNFLEILERAAAHIYRTKKPVREVSWVKSYFTWLVSQISIPSQFYVN